MSLYCYMSKSMLYSYNFHYRPDELSDNLQFDSFWKVVLNPSFLLKYSVLNAIVLMKDVRLFKSAVNEDVPLCEINNFY